jgi:hypothetical protein
MNVQSHETNIYIQIFTNHDIQQMHWFTVLRAACPSKTYLKVCYIYALRLLKLFLQYSIHYTRCFDQHWSSSGILKTFGRNSCAPVL